jgi:cell division protein FtsW
MKSDKKTNAGGQVNSGSIKQVEQETAQYTPGVEIKIITAMIFLMAFGLIMIFSASSYSSSISADCNYDSAYYFKKQLVFVCGGLVVAAIVNLFPYKLFKKFGLALYVVSIVFILLLKTPLGVTSGGATRWLNLYVVQLQVADVTKVCMIIFMAYYVSKHWKDIHKFKTIFILWVAVGFQAGLILIISSNLSSCLILLLMVFVLTLIVSRNVWPHVAVVVVAAVGVTVFIVYLKGHLPLESQLDDYPYQLQRFCAWLDPERYSASIGYQPLQALYAIGSGGLLGKGLGNGTQKLVNIPESQNDMIFAIICEELGVVGALLMFLMFGYLLYQMYIVVKESRNLYGSLVVIGVMLHIIFQIIVNVCVSVNFFPNTGVSLPFISSGGSAILCTLIEMGLVIGIRRQQVNRKYSRLA